MYVCEKRVAHAWVSVRVLRYMYINIYTRVYIGKNMSAYHGFSLGRCPLMLHGTGLEYRVKLFTRVLWFSVFRFRILRVQDLGFDFARVLVSSRPTQGSRLGWKRKMFVCEKCRQPKSNLCAGGNKNATEKLKNSCISWHGYLLARSRKPRSFTEVVWSVWWT